MNKEQYISSLQQALSFTTYQEFANWEHSNLLTEELAQWRKISQQKEQVKDQSPQSYDLARSDLAILWRKQLYFITSFQYISNWKLSVQIRAKKCPLSLYYWNWMRGSGIGTMEKGQVIQDKNHRMHYEFCDDLGIKKIYRQIFGYQPKFALFKAVDEDINEGRGLTWSKARDGTSITIPTNVRLEKFDEQNATLLMNKWGSLINEIPSLLSKVIKPQEIAASLIKKLLEQNTYLVVGCEEMPNVSSSDNPSLFTTSFSKEDTLFIEKPKFIELFKKQPHLWDHTTFLVYLFGEAMTINGRFIGVIGKDANGNILEESEWGEKVTSWHLPYKIFISNAPGSLLYRFEFKYINVKLEIKTQGNFRANSMFNYMTQVQVEAATFGGGLSWNHQNLNPLESDAKENSRKGKETKAQTKSDKEKEKDKGKDPSVLYNNTVSYNYGLGEFFNQLTNPLFFCRIEVSELLSNRLSWANNKQKTLNLPIQWPAYGEFSQKLGEWKWRDVKLESDYNGFFKERMEQGYILTDGGKLTKPNFDYETINSYNPVAGSAWDIYHAEEEVIEKREKTTETLMTTDMTNAEYSNQDYIGSPDANIWEELNRVNGNCHVGNSPFPNNCLGCLCGGGSHGNPNYNFSRTYNFTSGGRLVLKTQGSGAQTCIIPPQGGKVTFSAQGNSGSIVLETEKITRETKLKETKKAQFQEIDQAELENKETENETFKEEELDLENIEQEKPDQGLGEKSQEKEQEKEAEQETEQEQEEEGEKETEKEEEGEKEQEKEKEQEQEDENENEGEGEDEEEDEL